VDTAEPSACPLPLDTIEGAVLDTAGTPPQPDAVPKLSALVKRHMDRSGRSLREMEAASGVRYQTYGEWLQDRVATFPRPDTIKAFADMAGYSHATVVLAIAKSVGLDVDSAGSLATLLPPSAARLSDEQQDAILAVVRVMTTNYDAVIAQGDAGTIVELKQRSETGGQRQAMDQARSYLREAGAAAREGETEPSDPDVTVPPRSSD